MKNKSNIIDELSIIAKHLEITGDIKGAGDLKIDGKVQGNIFLEGHLLLSEGAEIRGDIQTVNFECNGTVEGNLLIKEKLTVGGKSKIVGDIRTKILIIEEGAEINGKCIAARNVSEET